MLNADWIQSEIARFVAEDEGNRMEGTDGPYFEAPLVGVASALDPIFERYREDGIVGGFHLTPREVFEDAFGEGNFRTGSVICWILPISEATRRGNAAQSRMPSEAWAKTRDRGEGFNTRLRRHVTTLLAGRGHRVIAPVLSPRWRVVEGGPRVYASTWSERHAAFAAGLGTFGLSEGFITQAGVAHRLGSVVTDLELPPSPRPYAHHLEYCLACGACIRRCPAGAITDAGHDKARCREYLLMTLAEVGPQWAIQSEAGCGLCQTRVPCESRIPKRPRPSRA